MEAMRRDSGAVRKTREARQPAVGSASVRRVLFVAVLAVLAIAAPVSTALADPDLIATFPIPDELETSGIAVGADGNVWFGENGNPGRIGRLTPGGEMTEFPLPSAGSVGAVISGPDNNLWFEETNRTQGPTPEAIGKITLDGQLSEFPLSHRRTGKGLTAGPDGNVWFTGALAIGKITSSGQITEYPLSAGTRAEEIVAGPNGDLWFRAAAANAPPGGKFGRITPDGEISEFALPARTYGQRLFIGPDHRLRLFYGIGQWSKYGTFEGRSVGVDLVGADGGLTNEPLPSYSPCFACPLTADPEGNLWYTNVESVSRFSTTGQITTFDLPQGVSAGSLASGPDGNLWFAGSRFARPNSIGLVGRIPPNLLEASLAGEWWRLTATTARWTRLGVTCVAADETRVCEGTLTLTTEIDPNQVGGSAKVIVLARRPYRLRAGGWHEFSLHLSRKTFGIRIKRAVLRNVQVTATATGGQDANRPTLIERPRRPGRHRHRDHHHRVKH